MKFKWTSVGEKNRISKTVETSLQKNKNKLVMFSSRILWCKQDIPILIQDNTVRMLKNAVKKGFYNL